MSRIPGLAVAGRVSSFYFKGRNEDLHTIGNALNVVREIGLVAYWRAHGWPDFCQPVGDDFVCR